MNKSKIFWEGVLFNIAKAVIICTPIYLANHNQLGLIGEELLFPMGTVLTFIGVVLTGVITAYCWRNLGYSTTQIWFRASLLDWLGTLLFMVLCFGGEGIFMFIYFSFFAFWIFPILIALGVWVGRLMASNL